jgi:hypothetical protein
MSHCTALDHLEWHHLVACSEIAAAPVWLKSMGSSYSFCNWCCKGWGMQLECKVIALYGCNHGRCQLCYLQSNKGAKCVSYCSHSKTPNYRTLKVRIPATIGEIDWFVDRLNLGWSAGFEVAPRIENSPHRYGMLHLWHTEICS